MLGVLASVGLFSKLSTRPTAVTAASAVPEDAPVKVRSETRAIARSQDSV
jgi:hypothetical protein